MFSRQGQVRWGAWLAAFVLLFHALAPPLAHALVRQAGPSSAAICGTSGRVWVTPPVSLLQPGNDTADPSSVACDACLLHAGGWALPPGGWPHLASQDTVVPVDASWRSAQAHDLWPRARPRAP